MSRNLDNVIIALSTWCAGLWVKADNTAAGTYSHGLNHVDRRHALNLINVIDKLFTIELTCLLTPLITLYHFLCLFLPSQVKVRSIKQTRSVIDSYVYYPSVM